MFQIKLMIFSNNKISANYLFMTHQMKSIFTILFWIIFIVCPEGICGLLPPVISEKIIISNLEAIISSNALSLSVFTNLRKEIDIQTTFLQFVPMHISTNTSYIYMSIIMTVLYGQWRFHEGSQIKYNKLRKIDRFTRIEMIIKNVLFLIVMVLIKDIQSAS